nr:immunoglobulin light chain junction region [Macaca mulatta]
CQQLFSHPFTF